MEKEKHPPGLFVLFFTEMWERFGFYSMLAMFTLYLKNDRQGFGWSSEDATTLYSNYLMFVYAAPLIGGWIADKKLGYRNSVLIGGVIFMVGYFMLAIHDILAVYAALVCLVVANGFFKPNVSAMVGHQYPEGSKLKDRAYNIFYMGINIGALLAPINAEIWVSKIGFNNAFAIAGFGMIVSVAILWYFRHLVEGGQRQPLPERAESASPAAANPEAADPEGPTPTAAKKVNPIDLVPEARRIVALLVIFGIAIVFWMVFHQNGSTLTYWADDNTDWQVSGIISNAINPFWVVTLTFPLVWLWGWLNHRNLEPSTPMKMTMGMFFVGGAFLLLCFVARFGEGQTVTSEMLATGDFRLTDRSLAYLKEDGLPEQVIEDLNAKDANGKPIIKGKKFGTDRTYEDALTTIKGNLSERGAQVKADLKRFRDEDKALQAKGRLAAEELRQHREKEKPLKDRLKQVEQDEKAFRDVKIKEGELDPLSGPEAGSKDFASALADAVKQAEGMSQEGKDFVLSHHFSSFSGNQKFHAALARPRVLGPEAVSSSQGPLGHGTMIAKRAYLFKMSPFWLILAYAIMTLAELMLSPMGLSLVSKVAPVHLRGVMMGGWFVATAIGNKLTAIGVYWEIWRQSTFFLVLAGMAAFMGLVLLVLLRPLKKAMPGV